MVQWDPAGEHIIVERPEQLALHVLHSVYRQSRSRSHLMTCSHPLPRTDLWDHMQAKLRNETTALDDPGAIAGCKRYTLV